MTSAPGTESAAPPAWFSDAIGTEAETAVIDVDGVPVAYRAYGAPGPAGLVLVHGGAAHARWWDHIAPLLAPGRRVVAIDLSGHGDSGRREKYTLDALGARGDGGRRGGGHQRAADHRRAQHGRLRRAADRGRCSEPTSAGSSSSTRRSRTSRPRSRRPGTSRAFGPLRVYPTREAAIARFRPDPGPADPAVCPGARRGTSIRAGRGRLELEVRPGDLRPGPRRPRRCCVSSTAAWRCSTPSTASCRRRPPS